MADVVELEAERQLVRAEKAAKKAELGCRTLAQYRGDPSWLRAAQIFEILKEDLLKRMKQAQTELTVSAMR